MTGGGWPDGRCGGFREVAAPYDSRGRARRRWGRTYESFGEDPRLVQEMETAIDGFQGSPGHLSDPDRVLATAKHFAGDGLTT